MDKMKKRHESMMSLKLIAVFKLLLKRDRLSERKEIEDLNMTCALPVGIFAVV